MKDVYNMTSKFFNGIISDMKGVSETPAIISSG